MFMKDSSLSERAEVALRIVREAPLMVFDVETSGVDWRKNFPVGWVIGAGQGDVVYIPTRHGGGGNLPGLNKPLPKTPEEPMHVHLFEIELSKAFDERRRSGKPIVGHHLKFDCHFAANAGVYLGRNLICTQNTQALIDEHTTSFSLDSLARAYRVTGKKGADLYRYLVSKFGGAATKDSMSNFWKLAGDDEMAQEYAVGDGVTTMELFKAQMREITSVKFEGEQTLEQVFELECDLIWTLFRVERRGVKIDMDELGRTIQSVNQKVEEAYSNLPPSFNVRSPVQVRDYVKEFKQDWPLTEKGNPSFTEAWLKTFPEGRNIIAVRKWTNLSNSFALPLRDVHSFNGRVHPTLNQNKMDDYGTISGRLSCSNPNLQQVPKHEEEIAKLFRKVFVADEGMVIREGDYSQMEPRMFAHYSEEPALVQGYLSTPPKDVHSVVAELFNRDRKTVAKRMNMGMFTGMFPKSFAGHMGVSLEEATHLWETWFKFFPRIRNFQDKAKETILRRGYVRSVLGRRGRLESRALSYKATSKIIQNGGADVIKYKMVQIDQELEKQGDTSHLLLSVHDSFLWQNPEGPEGDEVAVWIERMMEDVMGPPFNFVVPFTVDVGTGANWSEASFADKK